MTEGLIGAYDLDHKTTPVVVSISKVSSILAVPKACNSGKNAIDFRASCSDFFDLIRMRVDKGSGCVNWRTAPRYF